MKADPENIVTATIVDVTDPGYILCFEDGTEGQLRATEMKGETLEFHKNGMANALIGKDVSVYLLHKINEKTYTSQQTPAERKVLQLKEKAREECYVGQEYELEIVIEMSGAISVLKSMAILKVLFLKAVFLCSLVISF